MKRTPAFTLMALLIVLSLALAACGAPAQPAAEKDAYDFPENNQVSQKVLDMVTEQVKLLEGGRYGDLHEAIVASGGREIAEHDEFQAVLKKIMEDTGATYVYTLIKVSDDMTNLIVDASEGDDADDYGTEYEMEPQFEIAFAGQPAVAKHTWVDDYYGVQKSAFAPIYNSNGQVVAILGIDYPAPELGAYPDIQH